MRIGIDLDGVVFDSEKEFRVCSEIYDAKDLNKNSVIDRLEFRFQDRYNWTEEELKGFLERYHKHVIVDSNYLPGAKQVLKFLKEAGHCLILISARGTLNKNMITITEEKFKETGMDIFDKYYWASSNKDEICEKEKIDLMIDDYYKVCESVSSKKIKTIYLKDAASPELEDNEYLKTLYNWGEIYRYIKERKMNRNILAVVIWLLLLFLLLQLIKKILKST